MNTIIALTFIGILTYAFAEVSPEIKECNIQVMKDFDSAKFLEYSKSGPLYLTHAKNAEDTICLVYTTTEKSNGNITVNIHEYYYYDSGEESGKVSGEESGKVSGEESGKVADYKMVCTTTEESFKSGQYLGECKTADERYETEEWLDHMIVVATDYQSYAVLYGCVKNETVTTEYVEVLQKNPESFNDCDNPVEGALKSIGIELKDLERKSTAYCQKVNKDDKKET